MTMMMMITKEREVEKVGECGEGGGGGVTEDEQEAVDKA